MRDGRGAARGRGRGRAARPGQRARPTVPRDQGPARELTIDAVAAGGDGVGRSEGLVVFVPRTAPGDLVRARWAPGGRFARAELVDVVEPSPARVLPPCPHYRVDRCGGCQLQHIDLPDQREAKRQIVRDALARIGRRAFDVDSVVASPEPWRYRRKLTLALRPRGGRWIGGLHPYDAPGEVFELGDCPITDERVIAVWRRVLDASEFLPADARELRGAVRLLDDAPEGEPRASLTLEGGAQWPHAAAFFDAVPELVGLWWRADGMTPRLLHSRGPALGAASFTQVNAPTAALLEGEVVAELRAARPTTFVDAYAGAGAVAEALGQDGAQVTAIELDEEAAGVAAVRLVPYGGRAIAARVEDAIADVLPAEAVLVNPPRTGLDAGVTNALERAAAGAFGPAPSILIYVSCNPATLARDLARLPSYDIRRVTPFDMFPQTAHVETLVVLEPVGAP